MAICTICGAIINDNPEDIKNHKHGTIPPPKKELRPQTTLSDVGSI